MTDEWEDDNSVVEGYEAVQFKALDVVGATIHMAGRVLIAFGGGLQDMAHIFGRGAEWQRADEQEKYELSLDRNAFDDIISRPVLMDEPGEE